MKKLMALALALVLTFTLTAVGFAEPDTITYDDEGWDESDGEIEVTADASATDTIEVEVSWTNALQVNYAWTKTDLTGEGTEPYAWAATAVETSSANVLTFTVENFSSVPREVTAEWDEADDLAAYGLGVTANYNGFDDGETLGYGGAANSSGTCVLTLASKPATATAILGQAAYGSIDSDVESVDVGTMTFTVENPDLIG